MSTKIKCLVCNDIIEGDGEGTFTTCLCGQCFIDETDWYLRVGGDYDKMRMIDENGNEIPIVNEPEPEVTQPKIIYIFLDVDGVLNNTNYLIRCYERNGHHSMSMNHVPFDPECLNNLMKLVRRLEELNNEVKLILSSTWRLSEIDYEIVNARLAEYGLRLSGKTDNIDGYRGREIKKYLEDNPEYNNFIILDDDSYDIKPMYPDNLVRTDSTVGLVKEDIQKAMSIILEGDKKDDNKNKEK